MKRLFIISLLACFSILAMAGVSESIGTYSALQKTTSNTAHISQKCTYLAYKVGSQDGTYTYVVIVLRAPSGKTYNVSALKANNRYYAKDGHWSTGHRVSSSGNLYFDLQAIEKGIWTITTIQKNVGDWYYSMYGAVQIAASAENGTSGSVQGGGWYVKGANATLTAMPAQNYRFLSWSDGNTENPRTVAVTQDSTFVVKFQRTNLNVSVYASDCDDPVIRTVEYGDEVRITANTNEGYEFARWSDGNTDNPRSAQITTDSTFRAIFDKLRYIVNGEEYEYGQEVVLTAADSVCHHFTQWNDGNTDNPRTVTVTGPATYTEEYEIDTFEIIFKNEDGTQLEKDTVNCGTLPVYTGETPTKAATAEYTYTFKAWNKTIVEASENATYTATYSEKKNSYIVNGEEYEYGQTATLTAADKPCYHFTQWNDGNTDNPRTVTVTGPATYTEEYEIDTFEIIFKNEDGTQLEKDTVNCGTLPVYKGETPTKAATAEYTYTFKAWDKTIVEASGNAIYTAVFDAEHVDYTMTVRSSNCEISDTVLVASGSSRVIEASASAGYHFTQWSDGNTDNPRTVVVTSDTSFVAEFEANSYQVTFDGNGGITTSATLKYGSAYGTLPTPTRTAYEFVGWYTAPDGGSPVLNTTFVSTASDHSIYAHWIINKFWLTVKASACDNSVSRAFAGETVCKIEATPDEGYHFTQWNDGNTDNPRTITILGDVIYTAEFAKNKYIVNGEEHEYGDEILLIAADSACYHFTQWNDGNTDNPRTVTVTGPATYTEEYEINTFEILFKNEDGTQLEKDTVNCGTLPVYGGETPTKVATAEYTYTFKAWDKTIVEARANATYTATYSEKKNSYIVNGEEYEYGQTATLTAADKPCYHFTQWNDGNTDNPRTVTVTGPATYTEEYEIDTFEIVFKNEDGTQLEKDTVNCGTLPVYKGETPTKAATAEYTYTFKAWDKTIVEASANATYTATYSSKKNSYIVNGEEYEYGQTATLTAADKPCYHFTQWNDGNTDNPRTVTVTGPATYTEEYEIDTFEIIFKNEDGTQLEKDTVNCGSLPVYGGATPTKAATAEYTYIFKAWDKTIVEASANATYTATYTEKKNSYIVNGEEYEYGQTATLTAADKPCYHFTQWNDGNTDNPRTVTVTGPATYTEEYEIDTFEIIFKNEDGTQLEKDTVNCGSLPVYGGATPTKAATAEYTYTFKAWDKTIVEASKNATYTATYSEKKNSYIVNGEEYEYGQTATLTAADKPCYHFTQWNDGNTDNPRTVTVTGPATYTEEYEIDTFEIIFKNEDGTQLEKDTVNCGTLPVYKGETPTKAATAEYTYTFKAWDKTIVEASKNATYTATYSEKKNSYIVNGEEYEYGQTATLTAADKPCYHFTQWNDGNTENPRTITVTESVTYTAQYEVNHINLPQVQLYPEVVYGDTLHCADATEYAWSQVNNLTYGNEVTRLWWEYNIGGGFVPYTNGRIMAKNITMRYGIEACEGTQYSAASGNIVPAAANADNCEACDNAPAVALYDWLIMIDQKNLKAMGYSFAIENVTWYKVVGSVDDLSDAKGERNDMKVADGLYLTSKSPLVGTGDYYGIIKLPKQSANVACQGTMRTQIFSFNSTKRVAMTPTIVEEKENILITGLTEGENMQILVYDERGSLMRQISSNGNIDVVFEAEELIGHYLVVIQDAEETITFKYIVK